MHSSRFGSVLSVLICGSLLHPGVAAAQSPQAPANAQALKYKLTIMKDAGNSKRVKKGRVSSQAVVRVTDENDVPVAGIAVAFTLPELSSGGAAFAGGGLTSVATTSATGVASSGALSAASGSSFGVSVAASAPGGVLTVTVPVSTVVVVTAGISTGVIAGIVAAVAAGAVGAGLALKGKGGNTTPTAPAIPSIGSASSITFGGPK